MLKHFLFSYFFMGYRIFNSVMLYIYLDRVADVGFLYNVLYIPV